MSKAPAAKDKARFLADDHVWLDHATLGHDDCEWLIDTQRITLWNVKVAPGLLSMLLRLWWIDWRGGTTAQHIEQIGECPNLRYVQINQVRGLKSVQFLTALHELQLLSLYGLPQLAELPAMGELKRLRRLQLGQLKSLSTIGPALLAPQLEELQLMNRLGVTQGDVEAMRAHPNLRALEWFAPDAPISMWHPVLEAVGLPKTKALHADEWFAGTGEST